MIPDSVSIQEAVEGMLFLCHIDSIAKGESRQPKT